MSAMVFSVIEPPEPPTTAPTEIVFCRLPISVESRPVFVDGMVYRNWIVSI